MFHELDRYNGRYTEIDIISFVRSNDFTNRKQSVGFLVDQIDDLKMVGSVFEMAYFKFILYTISLLPQ